MINWDEFGSVARTAFFGVKRALASQKPDVCRHLVTEDQWQRIRAEVEVLQHDGCVNLQDGIDITQVTPGDHDIDGDIDRVTVRLMVSGVDCVVNQASGQVVSGLRERSDWLEDWTFERSHDAELLAAAQASKCPTCGAPLSIDSEGQCTFCHAVVPGAKTDWLVSAYARVADVPVDAQMNLEATLEAGKVVVEAVAAQAAEHPWVGHDPVPPAMADGVAPGVAAIQAHDPAFSAPDMVVAARELFLRLEDARNQLRPADVRPTLSDALYARESDRAQEVLATGRKEVRAYLDINDVSLVGATSDGGRDELVVRVTAQSARSVVDLKTGNLLEGSAVVHPWAEELVFERASSALTNPLTGLLAHRCPACGQEAAASEDGHCVYCGEHITGGEKDWILADVRPVSDPVSQSPSA